MGGGGGGGQWQRCNQYTSVSLCFSFFLTLFLCFSMGLDGLGTGCRSFRNIHLFSVVLLWAALWIYAPDWNICSFSDLGVISALSHSFCSLLLFLFGIFCPLLKVFFTMAPRMWLMGFALPCRGSLRAGCAWNAAVLTVCGQAHLREASSPY